jgi:hypothetical protein
MFWGIVPFFAPKRFPRHLGAAIAFLLAIASAGAFGAKGDSVPTPSKHIIGPTAILTEVTTGFSFPARVDTGAHSCSVHVEKIEIEGESDSRLDNVGKPIRFLLKGADGETEWVESKIATAVRVKSPSLKRGKFDRRYKVPITLEWNGFKKKVLVTLNDRTSMEYPLLIGRNFLRGDFLVDVDKKEN